MDNLREQLLRFVQQIEGIGFREALEKLAAWYGLSAGANTILAQPARPKQQKFETVSVVSSAAIAYLLREHGVMLAGLLPYTPTDSVLTDTGTAWQGNEAAGTECGGKENIAPFVGIRKKRINFVRT